MTDRRLTRRSVLGGVGAAVGAAGCLGGGGRESITLTGVRVYNWLGTTAEVTLTLGRDGSQVFETTETVADSDFVDIAREWGPEAATYDLTVAVADEPLGIDTTVPDDTWQRGRCAWYEVDLGSPEPRDALESAGTRTPTVNTRLKPNDEGPFGDACPAE